MPANDTPFDREKAREIAEKPDYYFAEVDTPIGNGWTRKETKPFLNEIALREKSNLLSSALREIDRLHAAISEPVESFGTLELIAWNQKLTTLLNVPDEEKSFAGWSLEVGCHLENFVKAWNSPAMQAQAARIAEQDRGAGCRYCRFGEGPRFGPGRVQGISQSMGEIRDRRKRDLGSI